MNSSPSQPSSTKPIMEPYDEHNQRLVGHVHPHDWQNPEPQDRYHMVVIGAGTAGLVTAVVAANLGAKVALIEKHFMGGDCLNVGCVPSKGVISAARAWDSRRREQFGAPTPSGDGDFGKAMERMRKLRADISHVDSAARYSSLGVDVFLGTGKFTSKSTVEVAGTTLNFRNAVIATGARAAAPPIPGLDTVSYLTNETIFSLTELPESMTVIGAGPIGCEMAQSFAMFGCQVNVLDMADHALVREDADAAAIVQDQMIADGVNLQTRAAIKEITQDGDNIVVHFERDGEKHQVAAKELLVAVGRAPNTDGLGLEIAGVEFDRGGVITDERLRTTTKNIYAAGDVTHELKFTHLADAHAATVIQNALFFGRKKTSSLVIPWCTYSSPEIAHVGLYEHEAEKQGIEVDVIKIGMDDVDRAILDGEDEGFLKVILEKGSDKILGTTVVASHAGDLLAPFTLAITNGIGLAKFAGTIFPYPTQAEVAKKAAGTWRKEKLTNFTRKIFAIWFRIFK